MKRVSLLSIGIFVAVALWGINVSQAVQQETIRITCWEGYADKAFVDDFKKKVKEKYKIDVEVVASYATGQEDFYNAAKNGTADLISPPADLAKTPRFDFFKKGSVLLTPIDMKRIPNADHMLPFFKADKSLNAGGKQYGLPYNCGPYGLAYNAEVVKDTPSSWNIFWNSEYAGKYTLNNNFHKVNIWITALALGYKYEDLFNIDRLDRNKIQPRLNELVKGAKSLWDGEANPDEFPQLSLATTWGFAVVKANQKGGNWKLATAKEGGSAWIDYWCITHAAKGMKKKLCEEWINMQLSPKYQAAVVKQQGVSPVVNNVGNLVTAEEKVLFNVGNNDYFKTVAIWQVMSEKTEKEFGDMWEMAKKQR
jgi:spermidine/putrescine-binding protein